jgi:hypothetical protein
MALAGALCSVIDAVTGVANQSLRRRVAGLLGTEYRTSQMSYDLRRLRLHGLIARIPRTNTYTLPQKANAWPSSTRSSAGAFSIHSSTPTTRRHPRSSDAPADHRPRHH